MSMLPETQLLRWAVWSYDAESWTCSKAVYGTCDGHWVPVLGKRRRVVVEKLGPIWSDDVVRPNIGRTLLHCDIDVHSDKPDTRCSRLSWMRT